MSLPRRLVAIAVALALLAVIVPLADRRPDVATAAATQTVALYEMNESSTATVLVDSSGNGLNGSIGPNADTGVSSLGATVHRFNDRSPTGLPAEPERLDTVPDSPILDPGGEDFAVSVRYRTTKQFGNLIQKGQNTTIGGYFKIELPFGRPSCLFIGELPDGTRLTAGVNTPEGHEINDGQFHVVKCERLQDRVAVWIDGVEVARVVKPSGVIANDKILSIAGKSSCDQITVTCDYFVGEIDWIRLEKGDGVAQNEAPHAVFSRSSGNPTTFNGTASTDSDGSVVSWKWDFGDGTTGTGATVSHAYTTGGSKRVTLTVTDDDGATDEKVQTFTVPAPPTTTTSSTTTTTTTTVDQQGPTVIDAADAAADANVVAVRVTTTSSP